MTKYNELSDHQLLCEVQKYDSRALEELYARYSPILYTLIKKIVQDEKTAEAILVEVFAIIWRKSEFYNPRTENPYVWIITLTRNRAIDSVRRNRASEQTEYYDDKYENFFIVPWLPKDIDIMDLGTARKIQGKVEKALNKLSDAQKYVLHLAFYEGYTINEIAVKLKIPVETVRNKVYTAAQNFKDYLFSERKK
ncbi:MAG: sigma-70 family RNA polymerase sigma factor [Melioribacteraceae bacterium]|nr:sigma-70 family RNA polymerase sigma factor [Melioribacteraceae bacterium]MCO6474291.1 sigma-70 family RNA polymerase sigma factor [Melioribacteraceae bacterium]MDD3557912.1 sigma-70 family RNA polymerase sigma factor [Melioribacteraceae bacterium]